MSSIRFVAFVAAVALLAALVPASSSMPIPGDVGLHKPASSAFCSICGFLVNYIEGYISSNTTEQQLMAWLSKGCTYLGSFSQECSDFVNSEIPALIQIILEKEPASVVCASFCNSSKTTEDERTSDYICPSCNFAAEIIEHLTVANTAVSMNSVLPMFQAKCVAALGSDHADQCRKFQTLKLPALVQWVQQGKSAGQFCLRPSSCV